MEKQLDRFLTILIICGIIWLIILINNIVVCNSYIDMSREFSMSNEEYNELYKSYGLKFFKLIQAKQYSTAYEMLSDECKASDFENDESYFERMVSDETLQKHMTENDWKYSDYYIQGGEANNIHGLMFEFGLKQILMYVHEVTPFDYKIEVNVIDGEGI